MIILRILIFLCAAELGDQTVSSLSLSRMDSKERQEFLASVEAEEDWLDSVSRRLSLPSAGPLTQVSTPTPTGRTLRSKPPQSAGPLVKASRKRRISNPELDDMAEQAQPGPPGKRTSRDDSELLGKLESMIAGVRSDIAKSEANTATRIDKKLDDFSNKITDRLAATESSVSVLGGDVARLKSEILVMKKKSDVQARSLSTVVEDIVTRKVAGRQEVPPRRERQPTSNTFETKYWEARRSLRMWPVPGPALGAGVLDFLHTKLLFPTGKVKLADFNVVAVSSSGASNIMDQVVVTFESIRLRDEVKSAAKNLGGDRSVGLQLEAPDHLRSHYQALQKLGYSIKMKHPYLKRNVKFDDVEKALVMDIKTSSTADWKTITYADAKDLLKRVKKIPRSAVDKAELDSLVDLAAPVPATSVSDSDEDDFADAVIISDDDENKQTKKCFRHLSFLNANARSLAPKVDSLSDCMIEKKVDLACITETWFQNHRDHYQALDEYADRFSLGIINRNRTTCAANLRQYGGVAIVFRYKTTKLEHFPLVNPDDHEIVAAVGRVTGIKGKVFCLACYAPPNLTRSRAELMLEYLSDVISEAKRKYNDCSIIVCGDFNQWPADSILEDHPDMTEVAHGSTRQGRSIDRSFTNFGRSIKEATTLPPLESEEGNKSDHRIAFARAEFVHDPPKTSSYTFRQYTERGASNFLAELTSQSWNSVYMKDDTSSKVVEFQAILDKLMDKHFQFRTITRKLSDPPWLTPALKKKIGRRRRVYDRQGRSNRWKEMKAETDKICRTLCSRYIERQKTILTAPDASRAFYRNVKAFNSKEKPPIFDVRDIYPEEADLTVAEKLADHFNAISSEFDGLAPGNVPDMAPNSLGMLSLEDVVKRLTSFKKPKSMVRGDIFPKLINRAAHVLAKPLLHIYNSITLSQSWPDLWKVEYVTPIPKKSHPQGPGDLRNISCTQLFSKVYESFILEWLNAQIKLKLNQYGGVKGSGTEHFLVRLWQNVLENIEDPRAGSLITSIDFAKAFNRLDFSHCIRCLQAKGADTNLIRIVASFLSGRVMRVKVGDELSAPRAVLGGVPQGSLLGVFLFNLAIDDFESYSPDVELNNPTQDHQLTPAAPGGPVDLPVPQEPTARDSRHTTPFASTPITVQKYVDDIIQNEKVNYDTVAIDGASIKDKFAVRSGNLFNRIAFQAGAVGMVVHTGKTQLLCIAETKAYVPRAHFFDMDGNKIQNQNSMKILGFFFSADPDMNAQVVDIKRKFRARIWSLRHLGHVGFSESDLLKVYKSVILPVHDYCSCVYNSSLTQTQSNALERLQAQSLKAIYGYQHSYRSLLEKTGLSTLQARRDARDLKFAEKCLQKDRYRTWFPLNPIARSTRQPLVYKEFHARTQRLYRSPIYNMRRRLNGKDRL